MLWRLGFVHQSQGLSAESAVHRLQREQRSCPSSSFQGQAPGIVREDFYNELLSGTSLKMERIKELSFKKGITADRLDLVLRNGDVPRPGE